MSILTIADPEDDRSLLSAAELRLAIGLASADASQDAALTPLGLRVSAVITKACRVASAGVVPPNLRLETVTETFRPDRGHSRSECPLILARRPIVIINSVIENGTTLDATGYEIDAGSGLLWRLSNDCRTCWAAHGKIVIDYDAGWEDVPDDLKRIASELVSAYYLQSGSDQSEKRLSIPGLIDSERWVDVTSDAELPDDLMAALYRGGYVNIWVG